MKAVRLNPRDWGVRTRSTLAAVTVLLVALVVVAGALLWVLHRSLTTSADAAGATRADQVATQLRSDTPGVQDGQGSQSGQGSQGGQGGPDPSLVAASGNTVAVQILTPAGGVLLASPGAPRTPLAGPLPDGVQSSARSVNLPGPGGGSVRVTALGVGGPGGTLTVVVATDATAITETVTTVGVLLGLGLPLVVAVAGLVTHILVGRSLRSVERLRTQVDDVSSIDLARRVPIPRPQDEIAALARTLNRMLERLQAAHQTQRRFVGDASHELRSPLATITTALELTQDRPEVIDRELVRTHLLPEALRMQRLVEDLLLLANADENGLPLRMGDVDLDDLVDAEAARVRDSTQLSVTADIHPARVTGDQAQLARVLRNLVDNAVRHARTQLTLTSQASAHECRMVVADDGPGIPATDRARVLQRFVRLDTGRARTAGGSGLGLAIVAEIVTAHRGTLHIDDTPGGGATITVTLPAPTAPHPTPTSPPEPASVSLSSRNR